MALIKAAGRGRSDARDARRLRPGKVGDQVVAIGSPEGLTGTVTSGIVSALDREVTVRKEDGDAGSGGQGTAGTSWPFEFGGGSTTATPARTPPPTRPSRPTPPSTPATPAARSSTWTAEIIGINSAMYSAGSGAGAAASAGGSVGLGFAIPVNAVKDDLGDMRSGGGEPLSMSMPPSDAPLLVQRRRRRPRSAAYAEVVTRR